MPVKKIAIIHPSSELYGADRILVEVLKATPLEIEKTVYLRHEGPLVDYIKQNVQNVRIKFIRFLPVIAKSEFGFKGLMRFVTNMFKFHSFMKSEQRKEKYQGFYLNTFATAFMLINLRRYNVKKTIHVHEIIDSPKVMNWMLSKLAYRYADLIICVSNAVRRNIVKNLTNDSKVIVLHNGIPGLNVAKQVSPNKPFKFYLFGRIMPKKGQWLLLEALAKVSQDKLQENKFMIVGGVLAGNEHLLNDLKDKVVDLGLEKWVAILPFSNNIISMMEDASVCLVPSIMKDPFPTTVLEAMSAGRLVIASDSGGAVEAIVDGQSGLLFEASNADALKNRIEQVLDNPDSSIELGAQGKERFCQLFTTKEFFKNWIAVNRSFKTNLV